MTARRVILLVVALAACALVWELRVAVLELIGSLFFARLIARRAGWGGRRRPKASWAKNVEALALLIAAWSTRGLVRPQALKRKPTGFAGVAARLPRPKYTGSGPGDEVPF